jgi:hypothetical protein
MGPKILCGSCMMGYRDILLPIHPGRMLRHAQVEYLFSVRVNFRETEGTMSSHYLDITFGLLRRLNVCMNQLKVANMHLNNTYLLTPAFLAG